MSSPKLVAGAFYVGSSVLMTVSNKLTLQSFPFPIPLLLLQVLATLLFASLPFMSAVPDPTPPATLTLFECMWRWKWIAVVGPLGWILSMTATRLTTISVVTLSRSITPAVVAVLSSVLIPGRGLQRKDALLPLGILGSMLFMRVDASTGVQNSAPGAVVAIAGTVCAATSIVLTKLMDSKVRLSQVQKVRTANISALPIVLCTLIASGQVSAASDAMFTISVNTAVLLCLSLAASLVISWAGFASQRVFSPTTHSVITSANRGICVLVDFLLFQRELTNTMIVGLVLSLGASLAYALLDCGPVLHFNWNKRLLSNFSVCALPLLLVGFSTAVPVSLASFTHIASLARENVVG